MSYDNPEGVGEGWEEFRSHRNRCTLVDGHGGRAGLDGGWHRGGVLQLFAKDVNVRRRLDAEPNLAVLEGDDRHDDAVVDEDPLSRAAGEYEHGCTSLHKKGVGWYACHLGKSGANPFRRHSDLLKYRLSLNGNQGMQALRLERFDLMFSSEQIV